MSATKSTSVWVRLTLPLAAALVLLGDQISKYIIVNNLQRYEEWAPIPSLQWLFAITHTTNTGAAFGIFPDGSLFFIVVAIVVVVAILVFHSQMAAQHWLLRLGLGLQLGGAIGNLLDRLTRGHVVDFLYFKFWPVFNVADSCVVVGAALMAYFLLREGEERPGDQPQATASESHGQESSGQNLSAGS